MSPQGAGRLVILDLSSQLQRTINILVGFGIIAAHAMFALTAAGRSLGADNLLRLERPRFLAAPTLL